MLTRAIIQTSTPMTLDIENVNPDDILILTSISGLSQAGAELFTGDFAGEGGYYQGRRAKKRTPVFNFKINPDYANDIEASDVREILYRMFMEPLATSDAVQVLLVDDRKPDRYIRVYTEDIEASHFEKEMTAMVSTVCTDAYLRSAEETVGSNPSGWLLVPLTYEGTADTGFAVTAEVLISTPQIVIENNGSTMTLDHDFVIGDIITVGTQQGDRYVRKNGADIMASLVSGSTWLKLAESANTLRIFGSSQGDGRAVVTEYRYRAAWWGL
jgi:hypothetical protein